ncbi:MAG: DUF2007 domain-containing protein [Candidatus Schekmanbacteria bacterium]|nr:MAG: DUF2007 domain-containing protein [Candidatus Schekmanbacteria bacterium]
MKKVYSSPNFSLAALFKGILEENGIACIMKNEHIANLGGEVPTNECWPEVWVLNDEDFDKAVEIISKQKQDRFLPSWNCPKCGENIEGQFTECWNCGYERKL